MLRLRADPVSELYLTNTILGVSPGAGVAVVQGGALVRSWASAYNAPYEHAIAVSGDVRTVGLYEPPTNVGGRYTLSGTATGTSYTLPGPFFWGAWDSTTDGVYNYIADTDVGVYRTNRDYFTNPVLLFNVLGGYGITFDQTNNSLWLSLQGGFALYNYSMTGALLNSFVVPNGVQGALALDPADQTLWFGNNAGFLEQYSKSGAYLGNGAYIGSAFGGEFNITSTPEPGSSALFALGGILLVAARARRRRLSCP